MAYKLFTYQKKKIDKRHNNPGRPKKPIPEYIKKNKNEYKLAYGFTSRQNALEYAKKYRDSGRKAFVIIRHGRYLVYYTGYR